MIDKTNSTYIKFNFQPYEYENAGHTIEKTEGNKKRRYLVGVSTGIKIDQHGERLTEKAIQSIMNQANSGVILLYPDVHGIRASEDIGILKNAKILPNYDWYTEYLLYDETDNIPQAKLDIIDTIWKQINGLPPYTKPIQKGFSIEGYIPPDGIKEMSEDKRRVIDDVKLDGTILVPRPAYQDGIANAVYKALGELPPWQAEIYQKKIRKTLQDKLEEKKGSETYFSSKYEIQDILDEEIEKTMTNEKFTKYQKKSEINLLFDEYKKSYMSLIFCADHIFQKGIEDNYENTQLRKARILKSLNKNCEILKAIIEDKKRRKNNDKR